MEIAHMQKRKQFGVNPFRHGGIASEIHETHQSNHKRTKHRSSSQPSRNGFWQEFAQGSVYYKAQ
jgi:hypothetical protein